MGSSTAAQVYNSPQMQPPPQYQGHLGYPSQYQPAHSPTPTFNVVSSYGQGPPPAQQQGPGRQLSPPQMQQSYAYDAPSSGLKRSSDEALQSVDLFSKRPRPDSAGTVAFYPQRPGERLCAFYMTTRTCSFGVTCRFDHPAWVPFGGIPNWKEVTTSGSTPATTDPANLPQRLGEPDCAFYMKRGECKYGQRCKFNHPKDRRTAPSDSAGSSKEDGIPGAHDGSITTTPGAGANGSSGVNGTPVKPGTVGTNIAVSPIPPAAGKVGSVKPAPLNSKGLPLRPGEIECSFYIKTGGCKYGAACRFNHPELAKTGRPGPQLPTQNHQSPNIIPQVSYTAGSFPSRMQPPTIGPQMTYAAVDMKVNDPQAVSAAHYQQQQCRPAPAETKVCEVTGVRTPSYQQQWQTPSLQDETKSSDPLPLQYPSFTQHWQCPTSVPSEVGEATAALTSPYQQLWSGMPLQSDMRFHDASGLGATSVPQHWNGMSMPVTVPMQGNSYADVGSTLGPFQIQHQWQYPPQSDTRVNEASVLTGGTACYQQQLQCSPGEAQVPVSAGQVTGPVPYHWQYRSPQANLKVVDGTPVVMPQYQQSWIYTPEEKPLKEAQPPGSGMLPIYPQRPGDPDCSYYLKTGECSFGGACKFHHPPGRIPSTLRFAPKLTLAGLPRRQGEPMCAYYLKTGACKYGSTCRFDHPPPGEAAAKLASEPGETLKLDTVDSMAIEIPPEMQELKQEEPKQEETNQEETQQETEEETQQEIQQEIQQEGTQQQDIKPEEVMPEETKPEEISQEEVKQEEPKEAANEQSQPAESLQYVDLNLPSKPDDEDEEVKID
ncbi:hypothetical protein R1sor_022379 [Riccia sorocarpa]|uniref:C3H1-type domain-containing protein n=1 Tax=Riccia sorocarpa TaxID=122646 RepID=A0ABD3GJP3_9MARC